MAPSTPNLATLVSSICRRPGMYVGEPHYSSVCAYIDGYDHARDGGPLNGFREWLIVRSNYGNNLHWSVIVRAIANDGVPGDLTPRDEKRYLRALEKLFAEFSRERSAHGVTKIHHAYAKWLLRKRWYSGPLRSGDKGAT